jgi:hypothetical protein
MAAPLSAQIADNSFLLEEAYNQEPRVVQHISLLLLPRGDGWGYGFTQEWPFFSQRHQLSATMAVGGGAGQGVHLGDALLNYRYQLAGPDGRVAVSPRLSLLVPTGDRDLGAGHDAVGAQVNLPLSVFLGDRIVTHWNAGATLVPNAADGAGNRATASAVSLGASVIWLAHARVNVLVETAWQRAREVSGPDATTSVEELYVVPGVRWAHDFASGLQIVPGVGYAIGAGPARGEGAVVLYLSFEHGF